MVFNKRIDFDNFLKKDYINEIGSGSQGICYYNYKSRDVYKIFYQYFDHDEEYDVKYTKDEFLKFSNINNGTYIFANDVIIVENNVIGYVTKYVVGKLLTSINPLYINLNRFSSYIDRVYKDNDILSLNKIKTFDVLYNIMYGKNGFNIIDFTEYTYSNDSYDNIKKFNDRNFNEGVIKFLVDGYFDEFIFNNKILKDMYLDKSINVKEFISLLKRELSECCSVDVNKLFEASKCLNKKLVNKDYERSYNLR